MFKQPRVPEYRESEGVSKHLKALTLFLKDFCQDAWKANIQRKQESEELKKRVEALERK